MWPMGTAVSNFWEGPQMKQLALSLILSCIGTQAWADAKLDCHQRGDRDRQLKGCTHYIEEKAADTKSLAVAHFLRASAYLHKGDKDLAIADLTKVIELDPHNGRAYNIRGLVYFNRGEHDRVIADISKAIELHSKATGRLLASHYMLRGVAYEKTRNAELAIADFRSALAIDPDQEGSKNGLKRLGATP
jgi:tetratricopeptide (TPR) repeat protein